VLPWQSLPEFYAAQAVTGFLWAAPFTVFAIVPVIRSWKQLLRRKQEKASSEGPGAVSFHWLVTGLSGSFLFSFLCLLMFFWVAMRYAEDFMPSLALLGIVGFWQKYEAPSPRSNTGKMYLLAGLILAGLSIFLGFLVALSISFTQGLR
jgi:hypothetical protein